MNTRYIFSVLIIAVSQFFYSAFAGETDDPFTTGMLLFEKEQYELAIGQFENGLKTATDKSKYHLWIGKAYGRLAEKWIQKPSTRRFRVEQALNNFKLAVITDRKNPDAVSTLAEFYEKAPKSYGGDEDKALQLHNCLNELPSPCDMVLE